VALVRAAAEEVTGTPVPVTDEMLARATDPAATVAAREAPGGASPRRVREHARRVRRRVAAARRWNQARRAHIAQAEAGLLAAARRLASHPGEA
jgi:argininosuccinate lyase